MFTASSHLTIAYSRQAASRPAAEQQQRYAARKNVSV